MISSFRKLTVLLGKLGISKDQFVHDHEATIRTLGFKMQMPSQRPPWKLGIEYGLSLSECVGWVKSYTQLQTIRKAEAQGLCKLIPDPESDPTDGV